jgi:hypothetical protein
MDTSNPWPQGQVVWAAPSVDITKPIVEAYNVQSGVAAPPKASGSTSRPAGSTGLGSATKAPVTKTPGSTAPKSPSAAPPK